MCFPKRTCKDFLVCKQSLRKVRKISVCLTSDPQSHIPLPSTEYYIELCRVIRHMLNGCLVLPRPYVANITTILNLVTVAILTIAHLVYALSGESPLTFKGELPTP